MFLNVILTILVITLITMTVLLTIWWRKYGKKLFGSISKAPNLASNQMIKDLMGNQNMGDILNRISQIKQTLSKRK